MHRPWLRPVLTLLASLALAASGAVALSAPAQAAVTDIRINEVEANGSPDWIELVNTGGTDQSLEGLVLRDDGDDPVTHTWTIPAGYTVPAGGRLVIDQSSGTTYPFGLGNGGDKVRLFQPDGTTLIDSFQWITSAGAGNTWSRCPDTTGGTFNAVAASKNASNANSCLTVTNTVKINEIQQKGAADWVELTNTGAVAQDLTGWTLKDNNSAPSIPLSGSLAPGAFLTVDTQPTFDLGSADSARLVGPDGTVVLSSFSWLSDTDTTYVRCPVFADSPFSKSVAATRDAANSCRSGATWPGGSAVTEVDPAATFATNASGLAYQGTGTATPGTLWAVVNGGPSKLYKLVDNAGTWQPDTGDWAAGKTLKYAGNVGEPDSEGVTYTDAGPSAGIFVATERDNTNNGVSRPSILQFQPDDAGTNLVATHEWPLVTDLPGLGANFGLEAIAWVPDSYLTSKGFKDQHLDKTYAPADYANHGNGLFFVGVEATGNVYAYALDLTSNAFQQVASFDSGFPAVMDLTYDPEQKKLWVECDNTCNGQTARFDVNGAGAFAATTYYERPAGLGNFNNEGFVMAARSECVGGVKPVFWADDNDDNAHALRQGTIDCTAVQSQPVAFSTTAPSNPVVGQTYTPAATGGGSGNPVVISVAPASAGVCTLAAGVVTFDHPGSCVVKADQAGTDDYTPGTAQQTITVGKANTTTTLRPKATTIEASVAALAPGVGTPTGTVLFAVDGNPVGGGTLSGGTASVSFTIPHDGAAHQVTAAYQGNADFNGSAKLVSRADPEISASISAQGEGRSADGWYHTPVTVTFSCTAHGAALSTDCPGPVTLATSGADQSVVRTITADDGGTATVTVSDLDIDLDAPTVAIGGVKAGRTYKKKQKPTCQGADALSGLASCTVEQVKDGRKYVVTATATDRAGNVTTTTLTYKVKKPKK